MAVDCLTAVAAVNSNSCRPEMLAVLVSSNVPIRVSDVFRVRRDSYYSASTVC